MSAIARQSNLFAAEDFVKVYKSFQDIDFTAYDFDTIRESLIEYIRVQYPEDFNDYTGSSEFVAIVELLAYLGTSLSFRTDLNARENLIDTAERRESIVRLARMINYQPKRNIAASGLFKLSAIATDQRLTDSAGNTISNAQIQWNDPNNPDWFDQFITIANAAFNPTNPFGRPATSGNIRSITTDLYELNNVLGIDVAYNVRVNVNGEDVPVDIVNPALGVTFEERHPNQNNPFNLIYRNDRQGQGSANTGFFLMFKQGQLDKTDLAYDFPQPNRVQDIDVNDINNSDVYVQEIDDTGTVLNEWKQVPSVSGSNIIYNSLNFNERNIFEVISGLNDRVSVKFTDGNFGNVPTGIIRYWYRTSIGRNIIIRPEDASNLQITIPYFGRDGQRYNLFLTFGLTSPVSNGAAAETNGQIKARAPQTYYTQDRMVNREDYNVFPLTFGNEIAKLRAINRTHAGHSRYIQLNDPTGYHSGITLLGEDGALYNEDSLQRLRFEFNPLQVGDVTRDATIALDNFIDSRELDNFFFNTYLPAAEYAGDVILDISSTDEVYWKTAPNSYRGSTGFFIESTDPNSTVNWPYGMGTPGSYSNVQRLEQSASIPALEYLKAGASVTFEEVDAIATPRVFSTSVLFSRDAGQPSDPAVTEIGPVQLASQVRDLWKPIRVNPVFRTEFTSGERAIMQTFFTNRENFSMRYRLEDDVWEIALDNATDTTSVYNYGDWFVKVIYNPSTDASNAFYEFVSRGIDTVFESLQSVRFYWDPEEVVVDSDSGRALFDKITVLPDVNTGSNGNALLQPSVWDLVGAFIQPDGFQDPAKIKIIPVDINNDATPDNPTSFRDLVSPTDSVIFEVFIDQNGYERTRPWLSSWNTDLYTTDPADSIRITIDNISGTGTIASIDAVTSDIINEFSINEADMIVLPAGYDLSSIAIELATPAIDQTTENAILNKFVTDYVAAGRTFCLGKPNTDAGLEFYTFEYSINLDETGTVLFVTDDTKYSRNGKTFNQNSSLDSDLKSFFFKWNHYVSISQVVDPSASNIIDVIMMTNQYYNDILVWKAENNSRRSMPKPPTTEDLRVQFGQLNSYKSISDELIFNSGKFKVLFGEQAAPELRAIFKAVKMPNTSMSDNELKTRIIQSVDQYFEINNWDFGERFYYTELAAFIHTRLSKHLSSVVIVPRQQNAEFGNLFEITANPDELFISTASVSDVEIVSNFTEANLRIN